MRLGHGGNGSGYQCSALAFLLSLYLLSLMGQSLPEASEPRNPIEPTGGTILDRESLGMSQKTGVSWRSR